MALDKAIQSGKEWRRPHYSNGRRMYHRPYKRTCPHCQSSLQLSTRKVQAKAQDELRHDFGPITEAGSFDAYLDKLNLDILSENYWEPNPVCGCLECRDFYEKMEHPK